MNAQFRLVSQTNCKTDVKYRVDVSVPRIEGQFQQISTDYIQLCARENELFSSSCYVLGHFQSVTCIQHFTWFIIHLNGDRNKLIFAVFIPLRRKQGDRREKVPHFSSRISISKIWRSCHVVTHLISQSVDAALIYSLQSKKCGTFVQIS